jgi:hypothetical protein
VIDHPAGKNTPARTPRDEQILLVYVALGKNRVDAGVKVLEIVAGIGVVDEIATFFAVTGAAPRVGVKDDIVLGSPDLGVEVEAIAVVREGTAENMQDQGIFLGGIKTWRLRLFMGSQVGAGAIILRIC